MGTALTVSEKVSETVVVPSSATIVTEYTPSCPGEGVPIRVPPGDSVRKGASVVRE